MIPKILVILGSNREGRRGKTVADWFMKHAQIRCDAEFKLVDLREWDIPRLGDPLRHGTPEYAALHDRWSREVGSADGFVYILPEYNHGYPGVLKDALDQLGKEWGRKPATFVSYGGAAGGARAVEQLRLVLIELQMASTRLAITIPGVQAAFDEGGDIRDKSYERRIQDVLEELLWWTNALKIARDQVPPAE